MTQSLSIERPLLMWVDLSLQPVGNEVLFSSLRSVCKLTICADIDLIGSRVLEQKPSLICFDYDYPDIVRLEALKAVKEAFPSIPVVMLTLQSSEALLLWAFRTGVRDCLIKPMEAGEAVERLVPLLRLTAQIKTPQASRKRWNSAAVVQLPLHARCSRGVRKKRTQSAVNYMKLHLHEKISLDTVAELCHLGVFGFARAFKRDHGLSFSEMLGKLRIEYAQSLLRNPSLSITDVAWSSGFHDTSYFARAFRKHAGVTPTQYREELLTAPGSGLSAAANDEDSGWQQVAGD